MSDPLRAFIIRIVRRALIWFFVDCADFGDVLFRNYNKVDLKVYRPAEGIVIRLTRIFACNWRKRHCSLCPS